jgi:hypothetical protein
MSLCLALLTEERADVLAGLACLRVSARRRA